MKIPLTLLALSSSAGLLADSCCEPCKPCCVPQPRAPICCECYVPAFYDMQCATGIYVDAEFLYWYARENDIPVAAYVETVSRSNLTSPTTATVPTSYKHFKSKWDPGFRIGLGWYACEKWDFYLDYTWYQNRTTSHLSVEPFATQFPSLGHSGIIIPWVDNSLTTLDPTVYQSAKASWRLNFNQIDLELGNRYYLTKCFTMRPYAGLRGAWIHTNFKVSGFNQETVTTGNTNVATGTYDLTVSDKFRNRNWGVGLLAGFQPAYYFSDEFSFYGDAGMALLWGQFKSRHTMNYQSVLESSGATDVNLIDSSNNNASGMHPVLDLEIGIRWETNWCDNQYAFSLDLGWEHHVWFDENFRTQPNSPRVITATTTPNTGVTGRLSESYTEMTSNIAMGGFVLRARFDF